jgi:methanogenic corrinoid protein MtbC1
LKKILNVALLVDKGRKISKVSKLTNDELREEVVLEITNSISSNGYENSILMAMLNFDQFQFETIYNKLTAEFSFRDIFNNLFIPLLDKIGLQWQSDTITPAHEHFISNLIYQKLHVNIEKVSQSGIVRTDKVFVLFLPSNEIHELGLLYIKYELSLKGYKTIYLGESVPVSSLDSLSDLYDNIVYVSYFTVFPPKDKVLSYLERFAKSYLQEDDKLWVLGRNSADVDIVLFGGKVKTFKSIEGILSDV